MNNYTIYCTAEQTEKAFNLGAPITVTSNHREVVNQKYYEVYHYESRTTTVIILPTAEQMIGWLEEQGVIIIDTFRVTKPFDILTWYGYKLSFPWRKEKYNKIRHKSRKEAILAAIDAALDYLIKNKK